jgi:hypothetical protein
VARGAILRKELFASLERGKLPGMGDDIVGVSDFLSDYGCRAADGLGIRFASNLIDQNLEITFDPGFVALVDLLELLKKLHDSLGKFQLFLVLARIENFAGLNSVLVVTIDIVDQCEKFFGRIVGKRRRGHEQSHKNQSQEPDDTAQ